MFAVATLPPPAPAIIMHAHSLDRDGASHHKKPRKRSPNHPPTEPRPPRPSDSFRRRLEKALTTAPRMQAQLANGELAGVHSEPRRLRWVSLGGGGRNGPGPTL